MNDQIIKYINNIVKAKYKTYTQVSKESGIKLSTLWRIANGEHRGNMEIWKLLYSWYESQTHKCSRCDRRIK